MNPISLWAVLTSSGLRHFVACSNSTLDEVCRPRGFEQSSLSPPYTKNPAQGRVFGIWR
jgi:hypothetical protein